ncbi:hypothetical protein G5V59_14565 [Nocardioides sp. W3-2-3]|uniref:hypothetical protein n=1 Tax=Nocardioides convexus TaxID=2712224 RepID=UPI0024187FE7|nr:hypothetical protein [Nocardioides convexus]NHA00767.1 hypothetical protein [Nocardioides convexus]
MFDRPARRHELAGLPRPGRAGRGGADRRRGPGTAPARARRTALGDAGPLARAPGRAVHRAPRHPHRRAVQRDVARQHARQPRQDGAQRGQGPRGPPSRRLRPPPPAPLHRAGPHHRRCRPRPAPLRRRGDPRAGLLPGLSRAGSATTAC